MDKIYLSYHQLMDENRSLKEKLIYYEEHDKLTDLLNQQSFHKRVTKLLSHHVNQNFAIIGIDVERFKLVNDLHGTSQGDDLLIYLAHHFSTDLDLGKSLIARIAADVFAICILDKGSIIDDCIQTILDIFAAYPLDMKLIPAIGIYRIEDITISPDLMCDRALMSLNSVKGNYSNHVAYYDSSMRDMLMAEHEIINGAEKAIKRKEFQIFMQPKCNMWSGKVVAAEALVRWVHPQKGIIPPIYFIPIFERNGFVKNLDCYVWEESIAWLREWMDQGHRPIPISLNVSRVDIYDSDICTALISLAHKYQVDPQFIELEITESAYANHTEKLIEVSDALMDHHFTVSMDDFGSGYSSLNILKNINVNVLKIDMRFLDSTDKKSSDILESIFHMAKWMNLRVIAEGVETELQLDFLKRIGCIYAQGYYYYKPMPLDDFERLLLTPGKIDFDDQGKCHDLHGSSIHFRDLFYEDVMSDKLLYHILGGIALYEYDDGMLHLLRGNQEYYKLINHTDNLTFTPEGGALRPLDEYKELLADAVTAAWKAGDDGTELTFQNQCSATDVRWLSMRLFYLTETNKKPIFYASFNDVTAQMKTLEQLGLAEQRFITAMEATNMTLFEMDIDTHETRYSTHSKEDYLLDTCATIAPEGFIEQGTICPGYENVFRNMYYTIFDGAPRAACVIKAFKNEQIVWNRITLSAIKNSSGRTVSAVGLVESLTQQEIDSMVSSQPPSGLCLSS